VSVAWSRPSACALALGLASAPGTAAAAEVEFGWTGTIVAVDPGLAVSLPALAGIEVGASVVGSYMFESTTPDAEPSPTEGQYPGAIVSWRMQLGIYSVDRDPAGPLNGIDVVRDLYFSLYQALASVAATPPFPGFAALDAEVFLLSIRPTGLTTDDLPLSPPSLELWDQTSAGLFSRGSTTPLVDIQLTALCAGPCPDSDGDGIPDVSDSCPFFPDPVQADADGNARGDLCECGDQNGDARVDVTDIIAINLAIFDPASATALCDANRDGLCDISDMIAVNAEIFSPGHSSTCARQPLQEP
jgi:hypothetical protein